MSNKKNKIIYVTIISISVISIILGVVKLALMVSKNKSDNEKLSNSINTISVKDQQNNNEMLNSVKEENEIEEKEQEMQPTFVEENKTEEEKTKKNEETDLPFSKGSSPPRNQTQVSHIAGIVFTS